jgi:hypothetical protein
MFPAGIPAAAARSVTIRPMASPSTADVRMVPVFAIARNNGARPVRPPTHGS